MARFLLYICIMYIFLFIYTFCKVDNNDDLIVEDIPDNRINPNSNEGNYDQEEFEDDVLRQEELKEEEIDPLKESQKFHEKEYTNSKNKFTFSLYEILMVALLVIYLLNCYYGKTNNDVLAQKWMASNREFYIENYAHIGIGTHIKSVEQLILKESYNSYKFYASGRVFCKSVLVSIDLRKRHDLVSQISSFFFYQEKDRINFEFALEPNIDIPSVFCLCRPKDLKQLKKSYSDLDFFTMQYARAFNSERLYLYAEHPAIFTDLFESKQLQASYKKIEDCLELIYYTDRKTFSREPNAIYVSFDIQLNSINLETKLKEISVFVHLLIDELSITKFSEKDRREAEKNRVEFEKIKLKENHDKQSEEYKAKKLKEKEDKYKNLPKEKLLKLEEKEKERELKKQQHKKVKMIKF